MFLQRTIDDILENAKSEVEVIAVLDGYWPQPPVYDHPKVVVVHHTEPIGQRAATNEGVRISQAKFVMKVDGHCAFDKGFDVKLMQDYEDDWTLVPLMYNLHAFDWKCRNCGDRTYQGPKPEFCQTCGKNRGFEMVIVWEPRLRRITYSWRFDSELKFQYWMRHRDRPETRRGEFIETMSLIGACFFMSRERYWGLDGLDEAHGKWGQVGTEVACKSWLSGGKLLTAKRTWFSHMFRTNNKGFSFPYEIRGRDVARTREYSKDFWFNNRWPKAVHDLKWLVDKFSPVPGWEDYEW
jgi:glycosyltransferase involved in cell wall biosynthesis